MNIIKLDNKEYILRCDINVLEKISAKYGTPDKLIDSDISGMKEVAAWMINEHFYYTGKPDTVTPDFIGARLGLAGYKEACGAVIAELANCLKISKNL